MSRYQPLKHNTKNAQIQWVNTLVHIHDLQCNCNDPLEHTTTTIFRQEPNLRFTDHEKNLLKDALLLEKKKIPKTQTTLLDKEIWTPFSHKILEKKKKIQLPGKKKKTLLK